MYSINVTNNSNSAQDFIVFQVPDQEDLTSLAWKSQPIYPNSGRSFDFGTEYSFVFGEINEIGLGEHFNASKNVHASLPNENKVVFDGSNFGNAEKGSEEHFTIVEEKSVPENKLAIGLSLDKSPLFISRAKPNAELTILKPNQTYFIANGQFREGEVIDAQMLSVSAARVDFRGGEGNADVTYEPNGNWSVRGGY